MTRSVLWIGIVLGQFLWSGAGVFSVDYTAIFWSGTTLFTHWLAEWISSFPRLRRE